MITCGAFTIFRFDSSHSARRAAAHGRGARESEGRKRISDAAASQNLIRAIEKIGRFRANKRPRDFESASLRHPSPVLRGFSAQLADVVMV